jgi:hypothetical protein
MIGRCVYDSEPDTFKPIWGVFKTWVVQAQYYWQDEKGEVSSYFLLFLCLFVLC